MDPLFLEVVNLWYVLIVLKVVAQLISGFNQIGCFSVLLIDAETSQLFKASYYNMEWNYFLKLLLSIIIRLRDVIVKVMFFLAKSRLRISEQIDLTISSDISAFSFTLYILSTS